MRWKMRGYWVLLLLFTFLSAYLLLGCWGTKSKEKTAQKSERKVSHQNKGDVNVKISNSESGKGDKVVIKVKGDKGKEVTITAGSNDQEEDTKEIVPIGDAKTLDQTVRPLLENSLGVKLKLSNYSSMSGRGSFISLEYEVSGKIPQDKLDKLVETLKNAEFKVNFQSMGGGIFTLMTTKEPWGNVTFNLDMESNVITVVATKEN